MENPASRQLETIACDYCGTSDADLIFQKGEDKMGNPVPPILRCKKCRLCYLSPRPTKDALEALYTEQYFHSTDSGAKGYNDYIADRDDIKKTFHRRLKAIEKFRGKPLQDLLDVGCAAGFCLEAATDLGWTPQGIEISEYAASEAKKRGFEVRVGEFLPEARHWEPESFDVITMWDYIEHVRSPGEEIRRAAELLKKGGVLAIATPNIASLPARFFGPGWMGIKAEEHLYYFDMDTLTRYATDAGLKSVYRKHGGKYVSLLFLIQRVGFYSRFLMKVLGIPVRLLGLGSVSLYVNSYDIMIVMARKEG
jgi:SAM-dependent methyltransferase